MEPKPFDFTPVLKTVAEWPRLLSGYRGRRQGRRCRSGEAGVALLAMLILVLVITLVLGGIFYRHQLDVAEAIRISHGDQALLLALSGESWAAQLLRDDRQQSDSDSLAEPWARALPVLPVDGGSLSGCLIDLQSRFNLNNFSSYNAEAWQREQQGGTPGFATVYQALLQVLGLPADPSRSAVLIDWIDEDNEPVDSVGAEQRDYDFMSPPRLIGNQMLADVAELADVAGYETGTVAFLGNLVTVLPKVTAINVNTATEPVLAALGADWGNLFVDTVLNFRPFGDLDQFYATLVERLGLTGVDEAQSHVPVTLVTVASEFFQLNLTAKIGAAAIEMRSDLQRRESGAVAVLARQLSFVPELKPQASEQRLLSPLCTEPANTSIAAPAAKGNSP